MDALPTLYARARKLIAIIELQLEAPVVRSSEGDALHSLAANLNALQSEISALEKAVDKNSAGDLWKR
jgi:hypothetical protein